MGTEAYSHEDRSRLNSLCFCMYIILVVTNEMVDVENDAYFFISSLG